MLRYSDKEWLFKTRDPQDYQNRLRQFDYVRLLNETGWKIIKIKGESRTQRRCRIWKVCRSRQYTQMFRTRILPF